MPSQEQGPSITLVQLIRQLRKFEGQQIVNAQGLAMVIMEGVSQDAGSAYCQDGCDHEIISGPGKP